MTDLMDEAHRIKRLSGVLDSIVLITGILISMAVLDLVLARVPKPNQCPLLVPTSHLQHLMGGCSTNPIKQGNLANSVTSASKKM